MHKYQPKGQTPLFSKSSIKRIVVDNALARRRFRKSLSIKRKRELGLHS